MQIPSGRLPGVMSPQEQFSKVSSPKISRSTFDRSHGIKTTIDSGILYPIFFDEAIPGDTMNLRTTIFGRMGTLLKPIMDNVYIDLHFFSCPRRLLWDNWEKFNGAQDNPADSVNFTEPKLTATASTGYSELSIFDYFGLPTKIPDYEHNSHFLRFYNLTYNQWYRDENLQDSVTFITDDGTDTPSDYALLPRGKRKDYFTSCLPWAQKADPVSIPFAGDAPVKGIGKYNQTFSAGPQTVYESGESSSSSYANYSGVNWGTGTGNGTYMVEEDPDNAGFPGIYADMTQVSLLTINAWREAFTLQELYERDARGGTRYNELILSHFGVISPDFRLQRVEYLGGGSIDLRTMAIAQTSESGTTNQGDLAATAFMQGNNLGFIKSFTEHELVMGLVSIRADLNYQQGLNRMWSRTTRFDHYWPSFAHLGEQEVLNKEIYTQGTTADDDVFGYQERYAEMRYKPSLVTGLFRSNATASLDLYHLAQDFSALPGLNSSFIEETPPISRVVATPSEPEFILDAYFNFIHARPMPTYSTPGISGTL
jgi:hypothetical protein